MSLPAFFKKLFGRPSPRPEPRVQEMLAKARTDALACEEEEESEADLAALDAAIRGRPLNLNED